MSWINAAPSAWVALHDNGWTTHVTESSDGVFHASAARHGARGFLSQFVEPDETRAKAAARTALALQSGHRVCSPRCTDWRPCHADVAELDLD